LNLFLSVMRAEETTMRSLNVVSWRYKPIWTGFFAALDVMRIHFCFPYF
jgi:hypothetical protein